MRPNLRRHTPRIAILAQQLNRGPQLFEITALFFTTLYTDKIGRRARQSTLGQLSKSGKCLNFFDGRKKKMRWGLRQVCVSCANDGIADGFLLASAIVI
jgi:hypothetical protein